MRKTPYELVFGQPPRGSIFPGIHSKDVMEEDVEDILGEEEEQVDDDGTSGRGDPSENPSSGDEPDTDLLGSSSKHLQLRKEADKHYRRNAERMQLKYTKAKRKKVLTFSPGDYVSVRVPRIDRSSTDSHRLPCVIVERRGTKFNLYRLRCSYGVLKQCYGEGDLELFKGELNIPVDGWEDSPFISLREASQKFNPANEFSVGLCNCKGKCDTNRCSCRQMGAHCTSKCHKGKPCANCASESPVSTSEYESESAGSPPRKKPRSKHNGRQHILISDDESEKEPILISDRNEEKDEEKKEEGLLTPDDVKILERGEWLTDIHILQAQYLLQQQFPSVGGLQEPLRSIGRQWKVMPQRGVQLLHVNNNHWVCLSTMDCPPDTICVYDSQNSTVVRPALQKQLATLVKPVSRSLTVNIMASQGQAGSSDCGIFAIANALALCSGDGPSSTHWSQDQMRAHLIACFKARALTPFPGKKMPLTKERLLKAINIPVFCHCRQPEDRKKKMALCHVCQEWYHTSCEDIPKTIFSCKQAFTCSLCML